MSTRPDGTWKRLHEPRRRRAATTAVFAVMLFAAACAGANDSGPEAPTGTDVVAEAPDGTAVPTTSTAVGEPADPLALTLGACINLDERAGIWLQVPCSDPHYGEVFHVGDHPASPKEPYPGGRVIVQYARSLCYDAFEPFVGALYEVSELEIGVITPTESQFENPRIQARDMKCFLRRLDGRDLVGTMRGAKV